MAKRFTDTDKWKKPFIKNLSLEYKLLWFYMLDDCDISGLWQVDIDVASLRIGFNFNIKDALIVFEHQIIVVDEGEKWFIKDFLEFQYGSQLSKTNNIFKSIDKILSKYDLYKFITIDIVDEGTTISALRGRISQKTKDRIFLESEFICQYCSEQKIKAELVVDHFIPLNKGGDNSDENLICSCIRCNSHKTDIMPLDFIEKNHNFINPTDYLKTLIKKLKAPNKPLKGAKDKDIDKDKDKDMDKDKDKEGEKTEFQKTFDSFLEMRKKIKKPPTERAIELIKIELKKLSKGNIELAIEILNQSIRNCWQDVFELKTKKQGQIDLDPKNLREINTDEIIY